MYEPIFHLYGTFPYLYVTFLYLYGTVSCLQGVYLCRIFLPVRANFLPVDTVSYLYGIFPYLHGTDSYLYGSVLCELVMLDPNRGLFEDTGYTVTNQFTRGYTYMLGRYYHVISGRIFEILKVVAS